MAALTQPTNHDWSEIYFYIATKVYGRWNKNEVSEHIKVESLNGNQMAYSDRLKIGYTNREPGMEFIEIGMRDVKR